VESYEIDLVITCIDGSVITEHVKINAPSKEAVQKSVGSLIQQINMTGITKFDETKQEFTHTFSSQFASIKARIPSIVIAEGINITRNTLKV
jgi:hypothetical protein